MTLALILFIGLFSPSWVMPQNSQATSQGSTTAPQGENQSNSTPAQTNSTQRQSGDAQTAQHNSPQNSSTHKATPKKRRPKKTSTTDCNSSNTEGPSAPGATGTNNAQGASSTAQPGSKNCPPAKVIVRQGGTSDPAIQLAGDQPPSEKAAVDQLLGSTDGNLKKLASQQLNANQQDMVKQVRQFMEQSRSAQQSGDYERARTLAWKAQLLSEELVNPTK